MYYRRSSLLADKTLHVKVSGCIEAQTAGMAGTYSFTLYMCILHAGQN